MKYANRMDPADKIVDCNLPVENSEHDHRHNGITGVLHYDAAYPPPIIGGKEKQAHLLAKGLLAAGVRVNVLTRVHSGNRRGEFRFEGVKGVRIAPGFLEPANLAWHMLVQRRAATILHIHTPSRIGIMVLLLGRALQYKVVFKIPNQGLLDRRRGLGRKLWLWAIRRAHLLVVLENDTLDAFKAAGIDKRRIIKTVNGVEMPDLRGFERSTDGPTRLIFVGRLAPQKRCEDVLRALAILKGEGMDATLDIVGSGPELQRLLDIANGLKLDNYVKFHGRVDNVQAYLQRSHILILASEYEGMPNVVLEAMCTGLPVISSRVGAVQEMLGGDGERWMYDAGDVKSLANLVAAAQKNRTILFEYGKALHEKCRRQYAIGVVVENYLKQYRILEHAKY